MFVVQTGKVVVKMKDSNVFLIASIYMLIVLLLPRVIVWQR